MAIIRGPFQGTGNGDTTVYTAPTAGEISLGSLMVHNTSAATITVAVHIIPSGDAKADANRFISRDILPDETRKPNELIGEVLSAGDQVMIVSSAEINYRGWAQSKSN